VAKTNPSLYENIEAFDLDQPLSDYTLSLRLAKENFWTREFTRRAIAEYKKFMYMAAISNEMVSPSKVVDVVWHEHITATQKYAEFCSVLGKQVHHVPSSRSRFDAERFQRARDFTKQLYQKEFGTLPKDVWEFDTMYDSLQLPKARFKIRSFIVVGLLAAMLLLMPLYSALFPIYAQLSSDDFFAIYISAWVVTFVGLAMFNSARFKAMLSKFDKTSFAFSLSPGELIYLRKSQTDHIVHPAVNRMVEKGLVKVNKDQSLSVGEGVEAADAEEYAVIQRLRDKSVTYSALLPLVSRQPVFANVENSMNAFEKYIVKSKAFGGIFYVNFAAIMLMMLPGAARILTGLHREKPVVLIVFFMIIVLVVSMIFLHRLS
jgi:uncharacterized protein (TIGR04222 family)